MSFAKGRGIQPQPHFVLRHFALDMWPYLGCVLDCNQPNLNKASIFISSYNESESEAKFTLWKKGKWGTCPPKYHLSHSIFHQTFKREKKASQNEPRTRSSLHMIPHNGPAFHFRFDSSLNFSKHYFLTLFFRFIVQSKILIMWLIFIVEFDQPYTRVISDNINILRCIKI